MWERISVFGTVISWSDGRQVMRVQSKQCQKIGRSGGKMLENWPLVDGKPPVNSIGGTITVVPFCTTANATEVMQ